ncbi:MAG: 16S rRNA (uracil(1498)-N(3))-methyltransferase [Thiohalomonadales bacterium]|nr:16S rRNA (uracil(1498)-N(3))-methyltransferase [Thiohalomonadales bacterium]
MRIPRIYLPQPLTSGNQIALNDNALQHVVQVLRLKTGHPLILFNDQGGEFEARLVKVAKREAIVQVGDFHDVNRESGLFTCLGLGISKGDRMDFALQKSVELGVNEITPLFTEHCVVTLTNSRVLKKHAHWQAVMISACEQSGRNTIPVLNYPTTLTEWLGTCSLSTRLILDPAASTALSMIKLTKPELVLTTGPEGGFSQTEIEQARQAGFEGVTLGPRVLRTESAALAGLTAVQCLWGDLA